MFAICRTSTAIGAGFILAGALLVTPGESAQPGSPLAGWGWNAQGQLGDGTADYALLPVSVSGPLRKRTVTAISAGGTHTCAVADGRAYCWGRNGRGQLGNNSTKDSLVPVAVSTSGVLRNKTVTAIDAGYRHTCAVADGRAYCWGWNKRGLLGNNSTKDSSVPVPVTISKKRVTAISAGGGHTCAVAGGRAYCWGGNSAGQLGSKTKGDMWGPHSVPIAVATSGVLQDKKVTAISAGNIHTCAIAEGRAYCWGGNDDGQLGNNVDLTGYPVPSTAMEPVAVDTTGALATKTVTAISAAYEQTCAVADGGAYCWGTGALGNTSTSRSSMPVAVDDSGALAGKRVTAISGGASHTCVIAQGGAYCWGSNYYFQLGRNNTADSAVPVTVDTQGVLRNKTVTAVSAGALHTEVLLER